MNGAESLVRTLKLGGIDVCFTNPGTSEMHFMAALDRTNALRCVLGLQENVVTGMADGYARMANKPAATLLHLGPGLANGLSNLHNASKAGTGIVNIVGDSGRIVAQDLLLLGRMGAQSLQQCCQISMVGCHRRSAFRWLLIGCLRTNTIL